MGITYHSFLVPPPYPTCRVLQVVQLKDITFYSAAGVLIVVITDAGQSLPMAQVFLVYGGDFTVDS